MSDEIEINNPLQFTDAGAAMSYEVVDALRKATSEGVTANEQLNGLALAAGYLIATLDNGRLRKSAQDYLTNKTWQYARAFRETGQIQSSYVFDASKTQ